MPLTSPRNALPESLAEATATSFSVTQQIAMRMLGDSLAREVLRSEARMVAVVSGKHGEGRSTLTKALHHALSELSAEPVARLSMRDLSAPPEVFDGLVVIDGPPLLEADGPLAIHRAWWAQIDGAIVIARARDVSVQDLARLGAELELRSVKRIALVSNERDRPPVARALRDGVCALLRRTWFARWMRNEEQREGNS